MDLHLHLHPLTTCGAQPLNNPLPLSVSGQNHCSGQAAPQRPSERHRQLLCCALCLWVIRGTLGGRSWGHAQDEALHLLPLRADHDLLRNGRQKDAVHQPSLRLQSTHSGTRVTVPSMLIVRSNLTYKMCSYDWCRLEPSKVVQKRFLCNDSHGSYSLLWSAVSKAGTFWSQLVV